MTDDELRALAAKHEGMGDACAKNAMSNDPWYRYRAKDTEIAANHYVVAAAIRARLTP